MARVVVSCSWLAGESAKSAGDRDPVAMSADHAADFTAESRSRWSRGRLIASLETLLASPQSVGI